MPTCAQAPRAQLAGLAHHVAQGGLSGGKGGQSVGRVYLEHADQKPCQEARFQVILRSKGRQRCHLTGFACGRRAWDDHHQRAKCARTPVPAFAVRRWCNCADILIAEAALRMFATGSAMSLHTARASIAAGLWRPRNAATGRSRLGTVQAPIGRKVGLACGLALPAKNVRARWPRLQGSVVPCPRW